MPSGLVKGWETLKPCLKRFGSALFCAGVHFGTLYAGFNS